VTRGPFIPHLKKRVFWPQIYKDMNKKHWYTVCLDGSVNIGEILRRIDESYGLAFK